MTVDEPRKFFQRHKITQYNTTMLLRSGTEWAKKYDRSFLRVLGTMEESINTETYDVVREKRCSIVDILGQTVTDDCIMTPLFGVRPVVFNLADGTVVEGNDVTGGLVFSSSWPYMLSTVYGDHQRIRDTFLRPFPTGEGCIRDHYGSFRIVW